MVLLNQNNFSNVYLTHRSNPNRYYNFKSVNLGVIAMKGYPTLLRSLELEPQHQMQFSVIPRTHLFGLGLTHSGGNIVSVF